MQKKILFSGNDGWSMYRYRGCIFKRYVDLGFEVHVVCGKHKSADKISDTGAIVHQVKQSPNGMNPISEAQYFLTLFKIYNRVKPQFIFHFTVKPNIYGSLVARMLDIPCISVVAGAGPTFMADKPVNRLIKQLYRWASAHVREMWFLNEEDIARFTASKIINAERCFLLPSEGINTELYIRSTPYIKASPNDRSWKFLLSARMIWEKGVGLYVEAAKQVRSKYPSSQFFLIGFMEPHNPAMISKKQMDEWVEQGWVEYMGLSDDMIGVLEDMDCVVLPSYYLEGVPMSLMEAASMEIPIITSDNPGCREVVDDGINGYLCKPKDLDSLVNAIEKFIALTSEQRAQMGKAGRIKMKTCFHESIVVEKYVQTILKYSHV